MAAEEDKKDDLYAVLGLNKECTASELRTAYKKLALKWHPDRCSALGNPKSVEEAKKKFQAIQQAYSVLADTNKRFLYDVGVYDCDDDDDENGMGDFLNEMAAMMSENKTNENQGESFEELQELFEEMFQSDIEAAFSSPSRTATPSACSSSSSASCSESYFNISAKRSSSDEMSNPSRFKSECNEFDRFCMGVAQERAKKGKGAGERTQGGTRISEFGNTNKGRKFHLPPDLANLDF
nr:dnaJ homolog subfamily B member 7 isoform X1 [Ipomoea trifida]